MSNVIRASAFYSATDKQAIVGKIYEDVFTDGNGNTSLRYVRLIKATAAIKEGDVCQSNAAGTTNLYSLGEAGPIAALGGNQKIKVAGVALTAIASGSFGFVVCQGVVNKVKVASGYSGSVGDLLQVSGTIREAEVYSTGAGNSLKAIGVALTTKADGGASADPRYTVSAYINVL
tara:strand:- start:8558 stop:9082 length:525 start_codon:yes stop_codon:yes gene_type:complete